MKSTQIRELRFCPRSVTHDRANVADHGAATDDFPLQTRPDSSLPCIGLLRAVSIDRNVNASIAFVLSVYHTDLACKSIGIMKSTHVYSLLELVCRLGLGR